jgi:hypothetical protein
MVIIQRTVVKCPAFDPVLMRETLMLCSQHAGTDEYSKGVLVASIGIIMALLPSRSWYQALQVIKPFLPKDMNLACIPESWQEEFAKMRSEKNEN